MRKLMWFTIGFTAVCAFCAYYYVEWLLWIFAGAMLIGLILAVLGRKRSALAAIALVFLGISIGSVWFWGYDALYLSAARSADGKILPATVEITDYGYATDYGTAADGKIILNGKTFKVRVYLNGEYQLSPSDQVYSYYSFRFTAHGGRKAETNHPGEGIYLLLYQEGGVQHHKADEVSILHYPAVWRRNLLTSITECFPEDTAGFAKALLLGDRSGIDYSLNTAFKVSGISHIIAVSGLHVSILFGLLYTLTLRRRILSGIIGIPALILFAAVVGFSPSVTRACVMQILMLLAMMTDREYDPPTALAFAVLIMLAVNPMAIISVSLQLSVGCMVGIFLFSGKIRNWLNNHKSITRERSRTLVKLYSWFSSSVSVSISAAVITTPLVALYFGTVSLVGVITNLLTLWVISFIFYGIVLSLVLGLFWAGAASVFANLVSWLIRYVIISAKVLSGFPMAAVYTESIYIVIWLVGIYCLLAAFIMMKKKYPLVFFCSAAISLCVAMLLNWSEPLLDDIRVTVLDVGQGQCILLQSEGKTYMVDCGGDSDTIAADTAAEFLLSQGIDRLDGIILTHYDADHSAGVPYLLSRVGTDAIYLPQITDKSGTLQQLQSIYEDTVIMVKDDLVITLGTTKLTIFASETTNSGNESGLCVLFQREECDILVTGDRGEFGELLLLRRTELPKLEVLIAGHHGSAYSTGDELLAQTTPEIVIISAGLNNRYGHPAPKLLERLAKWCCIVYRTDYHGTVIYRG